jgi:hypothetical protein
MGKVITRGGWRDLREEVWFYVSLRHREDFELSKIRLSAGMGK